MKCILHVVSVSKGFQILFTVIFLPNKNYHLLFFSYRDYMNSQDTENLEAVVKAPKESVEDTSVETGVSTNTTSAGFPDGG